MAINNIAFLHGWGLNRQVWREVVERLKACLPNVNYQLLDLPGYGGQNDIDNAHVLTNQAHHCLNQLAEPTLLVGWSLGGMVAMQAALLDAQSERPKVQALQLITTAPRFVESDDWSYGVDLAIFQRFSDELASDYERTLTMFLLLQAGSNKGSRELARTAHAEICKLAQPSPKTLQDGIDCLAVSDLRADLLDLQLPVQVVSGLRDRVAKPESSRKLAQLLKADLHEFDSGHSPFMTHTNEYCETLLGFYQRVQS